MSVIGFSHSHDHYWIVRYKCQSEALKILQSLLAIVKVDILQYHAVLVSWPEPWFLKRVALQPITVEIQQTKSRNVQNTVYVCHNYHCVWEHMWSSDWWHYYITYKTLVNGLIWTDWNVKYWLASNTQYHSQLLYPTLLYKDSVSSPAPIANRVITLSHLTLCTTSHYGIQVCPLVMRVGP